MAEPEKVADSDPLPLRLHWRQTWPDKEADYVADADGYTGGVGRIYRYGHGPQQGLWFWAMNAHGPEISRPPTRFTASSTHPAPPRIWSRMLGLKLFADHPLTGRHRNATPTPWRRRG
jgi:hypothetical protein